MTEPQPMDAANWMAEYGCLKSQVRFELDGWALVSITEGDDGTDCVHSCCPEAWNKGAEVKGWSYQLAGAATCAGCDAPIPDEIQGLWQLSNMDSTVFSGRWMHQELDRQMKRVFMQNMKDMCCDAFESPSRKGKITGVTAPE